MSEVLCDTIRDQNCGLDDREAPPWFLYSIQLIQSRYVFNLGRAMAGRYFYHSCSLIGRDYRRKDVCFQPADMLIA